MNVYIADVKTLDDPEKFASAYQSVDAARREKVDRYRFHKDKMLSLGAGVLLRKALGDAGVNRAKLAVTETGKPYLENTGHCYFSLSHSGSKVLCAVADVPIGCDIEEITPPSWRVMDLVFSPEERALFADKGSDERRDLFYTLWTGKESYLKMTGQGIADDLQAISILVPFGRQMIRGRTVTFFDIPCGNDYKAAVCVEGIHDAGALRFRSVQL